MYVGEKWDDLPEEKNFMTTTIKSLSNEAFNGADIDEIDNFINNNNININSYDKGHPVTGGNNVGNYYGLYYKLRITTVAGHGLIIQIYKVSV